jgi:aminopeptidase
MNIPRAFFFIAATWLTLAAAAQNSAQVNYQEVAHKIITASVLVKPGEKVVMQGGKHMIPFMEALAIECNNAGASVTILLASDKVEHNRIANAPEDLLGDPGLFPTIMKNADVYIGLAQNDGDIETTFREVSQSRFKKIFGGYQLEGQIIKGSKARSLNVITPFASDPEAAHMDFAAYQKMVWDAINVDYTVIAKQGIQLKDLLSQAKTVKITTANGTDFSFSTGARSISLSQVVAAAGSKDPPEIPGGKLELHPLETSGNGKIVAAIDTCGHQPLLGADYHFKEGKIVSFKAEQNGSCFEELQRTASAEGKDLLFTVSIGLNPGYGTNEETNNPVDPNAAGMVYVSVGSDQLSKDPTENPISWRIPITNATVEIDGKVVIKEGKVVI